MLKYTKLIISNAIFYLFIVHNLQKNASMSKFKILPREHSCQVPHLGGPNRDLLYRDVLVGGDQYQLQEKS